MTLPELLKYDLSPDVTAFSATRSSGYSRGNYGKFNINLYCGDDIGDISKNRAALAEELGIDEQNIIIPHQVHGTKGIFIGKNFTALPKEKQREELEGKDYIVTQEKRICIGISTADCVPVLLYCESPQTVAAVHAGWRGTLKRITFSAVTALKKNLNADPSKIHAVIGSSISLDAFEVGNEVYDFFKREAFNMDEIAAFINGKWHIDLWKANEMQLIEAGVAPENIHVSGICTYRSSEKFFSARKLGINSGRIMSGIIIE